MDIGTNSISIGRGRRNGCCVFLFDSLEGIAFLLGSMRDLFPKYILLLVGIVLGCAHLWLALKAMFVFRSDEPASTWNFIVSGPLSTLPAVIVSYFWPKIGGTWLIVGSVLSFLFAIASMQTDRNLHDIVWYFTAYSGPMLVLGIGAIFCSTSKSE